MELVFMKTRPKAMQLQDLIVDIAKLINGGLNGDREAVLACATALGQRLEKAGETVLANSIRATVTRDSKKLKLARVSRDSQPNLPVDGESRLPVADEERYRRGEVSVVFTGTLQNDLKQFLDTFKASEQLSAHGIDIAASMLLYGPPGCGKTQIARFIAAELELPLIVARMDSLISSYLGSTAKNLRLLFEFAASHPCILFLDEFDALAKMRDDARELGELKRVVISLLQNIDALGRDHLLIAATNHDHLLDPAVWRRFAHRIHVTAPDREARRQLLKNYYRTFADDETISTVVALTEGLSGAQIKDVAETAVRDAILQKSMAISQYDAVNSALRATIGESGLANRIHYLYSFDKKTYTQSRLAELFNVSQPQISRMLKDIRNGEPLIPTATAR
jgi:hypothetical protein